MSTKTPPKFIADCHLGKLAKYLRVMGFDTLYFNTIDDNELVSIAKSEGRVILTRDKALHERKEASTFYLESIENLQQLKELEGHFSIKGYRLRGRCIVCNTRLESIDKSDIKEEIPKKVREHFSDFEICHTCDRIYWHGDHYRRMMKTITSI